MRAKTGMSKALLFIFALTIYSACSNIQPNVQVSDKKLASITGLSTVSISDENQGITLTGCIDKRTTSINYSIPSTNIVGSVSPTNSNCGDLASFSISIAPNTVVWTASPNCKKIKIQGLNDLISTESFEKELCLTKNITLTNTSITEGNAIDAVIGIISIDNPSAGMTYDYTVNDTIHFKIDSTTHELKANMVFNYHTNNSYPITIKVKEQTTPTYYEQNFTITIIANPNAGPTFTTSDSNYNSSSPNVQNLITLNYVSTPANAATGCSVTGLTNANITTPCSCNAGTCTVGITPLIGGDVTFTQEVSGGGVTSNAAVGNFISKVNVQPMPTSITAYEWDLATVNVTLTNPSTHNINIAYTTSTVLGGLALPLADYIPQSGILTIPAGSLSSILTVPLINDHIFKGTRLFHIDLTAIDSYASIASSNSTIPVNIMDDDSYKILNTFVSVSAGSNFTCGILTSGAVTCWGSNNVGQIGDNTFGTNRLVPTNNYVINGSTFKATMIATGAAHTCALLTSSAVKCWGLNSYGQIGDNTSTNRLVPTDVSGLNSGVFAISAGSSHTCALLTSGAVKCWGFNANGQIGDNTSGINRLIPTDVSGLSSGVIDISAGSAHTCALLSSGAVKCWGLNSYGQIGDNTYGTNRLIPTNVSSLSSGAIALTTGANHTCALTTGGTKCWGYNANGQIGDGTSGTNRLVPTDVSGLSSGVVAISAGNNHSCALLSTGGVKCWGDNANGQLGNLTLIDRLVPTEVNDLSSGVSAISAGDIHTCALLTPGDIKCWGNNSFGQLGDGRTSTYPAPPNYYRPIDVYSNSYPLTNTNSISLGNFHSCSLLTTGGVKCWGDNSGGQIGDATVHVKYSPTDVSGLSSGVRAIKNGNQHSCAILHTGGVQCWGFNANGQLGDNTSTNRLVPTTVSGLSSGVNAIASSELHTCALLTTGGVKCWGYNGSGQIGDGTSGTNRLAPTDVSGLSSGLSAITTGSIHTCALLTVGAVKCWGGNTEGELGDNTNVDKLTPTDVTGLSSGVTAISSYKFHTCALLTSGAVKCWGANSSGQLGDGTATDKRVPTDVLGLSSGVIAITTGSLHSCALLSSGAVKCWGDNSEGQLGDNTNTPRLIPTAVPGLTSGIKSIVAGSNTTCAVLSTGSAKCWGNNEYSKLGNSYNYLIPQFVLGVP